MAADFEEACVRIRCGFQDADKAGDPGSYARLATILSELEAQSREYVQEATKSEINRVIKKLGSTQPLTGEEHELIKTWLVGDAEYYTKLENNFGDWLSELKRLTDEIEKTGGATSDFKTALHLQALLKDAIRTTWDIYHYLEHKERIDNFTESTQELDSEERNILIDILKQKLGSADF